MYRKILIGGATAAVILGSGTAALALSGSHPTSGSPASPATATAAAHGKGGKHGHRGHRLLRRAVHGELTVRARGSYVTIHIVKGTVTTVSATSITVKSADDTSETFGVNADTKVRARAGGKATDSTIGAVQPGDRVLVAGPGANSPVAKHIVDVGTK